MTGTIGKTCAILADVLAGRELDRHDLAARHGVRVAAADRYIAAMSSVPGVETTRKGRRLILRRQARKWGFDR